MKIAAGLFALTAVSLTPVLARGQDAGWPHVIDVGRTKVVVYEPQPDSLQGITLRSRMAVSVMRPEDQAPLFGALWADTTLSIDSARNQARAVSVRIGRTHFNGLGESDVRSLIQSLEANWPRWNPPISLMDLSVRLRAVDSYSNIPPKIVVMDSPAILLLLDGSPRLEDVGAGGLQRVVNTALPVIFDSRIGRYWLYGSSGWFLTNDLLHGPWIWADYAPSNIADLVRDNDTLDSTQIDAGRAASPAQLRTAKVVVATEPTELLVTEGAPHYSPLAGGDLYYVTNTDSDIFLEGVTRRHYIVISGRWFAGPSLQGPWTFVPPETLPRAFAHIPENSPKADVLAFVPGTDLANHALLDNAIPQTAEVARGTANISVQYDGTPQFAAIHNTSLAYAENTPSEVIRSGTAYYACEAGIWYVALSPWGPWTVSDRRPDEVEKIPTASPVYNTKYVYIYNSTPYVVHTGCLPGYGWSLPYHGVIVYGTGWRYRAWFGRYYYPRPVTWGFFPRYNPWTGWTFGMSWTPGWLGLSSRWGVGWAGWGPVYGRGVRPGYWAGFHSGGWFGPGGYRAPRPWSSRPPGRPMPGRPAPDGPPVRPPRPGTHPGRNGLPSDPQTRPGRPLPGGPRPVPRPEQVQPGRPDRPDSTGRGRGEWGRGRHHARPDAGKPGREGRGNRTTQVPKEN